MTISDIVIRETRRLIFFVLSCDPLWSLSEKCWKQLERGRASVSDRGEVC